MIQSISFSKSIKPNSWIGRGIQLRVMLLEWPWNRHPVRFCRLDSVQIFANTQRMRICEWFIELCTHFRKHTSCSWACESISVSCPVSITVNKHKQCAVVEQRVSHIFLEFGNFAMIVSWWSREQTPHKHPGCNNSVVGVLIWGPAPLGLMPVPSKSSSGFGSQDTELLCPSCLHL